MAELHIRRSLWRTLNRFRKGEKNIPARERLGLTSYTIVLIEDEF